MLFYAYHLNCPLREYLVILKTYSQFCIMRSVIYLLKPFYSFTMSAVKEKVKKANAYFMFIKVSEKTTIPS